MLKTSKQMEHIVLWTSAILATDITARPWTTGHWRSDDFCYKFFIDGNAYGFQYYLSKYLYIFTKQSSIYHLSSHSLAIETGRYQNID